MNHQFLIQTMVCSFIKLSAFSRTLLQVERGKGLKAEPLLKIIFKTCQQTCTDHQPLQTAGIRTGHTNEQPHKHGRGYRRGWPDMSDMSELWSPLHDAEVYLRVQNSRSLPTAGNVCFSGRTIFFSFFEKQNLDALFQKKFLTKGPH